MFHPHFVRSRFSVTKMSHQTNVFLVFQRNFVFVKCVRVLQNTSMLNSNTTPLFVIKFSFKCGQHFHLIYGKHKISTENDFFVQGTFEWGEKSTFQLCIDFSNVLMKWILIYSFSLRIFILMMSKSTWLHME